MKKLSRIIAVISALVLAPVGPSLAADYSPVGVDQAAGMIGVYIKDATIGGWLNSLVIDSTKGKDGFGHGRFCPSLDSGGCTLGEDSIFSVMSVLPPCGEVTENCIESVDVFKSGSLAVPAKYLKSVAGISFPSTPSLGNAAGSTPSIWQAADSANGEAPQKYVVSPGLNYEVVGNRVRIVNFGITVNPVVDFVATGAVPSYVRKVTKGGVENTVVSNGINGSDLNCAATDTDYCAKIVEFAPETRVRVALRITNKVTGWLHGRVSKPSLTVEKISGEINRLVIEADSVRVPEMYVPVSFNDQPLDLQRELNSFANGGGDIEQGRSWRTYAPESPGAFKFVQAYSGLANDTAVNTKTSWSLASFGEANSGSGCLSDTSRLIGVVTTNSLAYDGGVPRWDGSKLNYRVAGLHWMPDGKTPVEGTYDLALRSDSARCLYGFTSAPISASISVTGSNGESKVATTVVSEKDGWLKLAAYGFTFSSPTISVKLSQAKAPAKKTTITCVKGKLIKKVTAVGPKCPAGYKKK